VKKTQNITVVSLVWLLVVGSVQANESIEEITVRSSRVERSMLEVPAAIGVVTIDDIQLGRQQLGLDESLTRIPGVFAQNRYNFAQDLRVAIRGFGARANFGIRGLKIFIDDIPATTADGQSGVDDIDLNSLARIEVTRGPSSAAYGAASGGVLNLYSEEGTQEPYLQAGLMFGEDNQRRYQLKTGGRSGRWSYMASLTDLDYEGYRDLSEVEATQFNSKVRYSFDNGAELSVIANVVDSPTAEDAGALNQAQVDSDPTQAQPRNLSSNAGEAVEQQRLGLVLTKPFGDGHDFLIRNYYVKRDFAAFLPIGTHIPFVADDGVVEFDRFFYGAGLQVNFSGQLFDRPNRLSMGFEVDVQEDDRQRFLNNAGSKGDLTFDQLEEATAYGVYLRNEFSITDTVLLSAGLRFDAIELEVDDKFLANGDQSSSLDFDEVSPTVGLVWMLGDGLSLYANYATSFETPTFTELANPARNLSVSLGGFNNVRAQQADSFELGFKGNFLADRLYVDAAVFSMQVEDEITNVADIGNRAFFENADTDRRGLELLAQAQLSTGLQLTFAYTYSDFEFDAFPADPSVEGNDLPGLPEHQLFAEFKYQHKSGFYAALDALYIDELNANNSNTVSTESATVTNVRMGFKAALGRLAIAPFVGVNNLFDEEYNSNLRLNGFGGRFYEPAPDTNFYAGVTLKLELQ
jgi:iron complex outermembrane recepter protein